MVEGARNGRGADGPAVRVPGPPPAQGEPRRARLQRPRDPAVQEVRVRGRGAPSGGTVEAGPVREPREDVDPRERVSGRATRGRAWRGVPELAHSEEVPGRRR